MSTIKKRIIGMILGNIVLGIAIGVLRIGELGTDPFATMNLGVSSTLGLSFGFYQVIFNFALFTVLLFYGRHLIGFGTLVNMIIIGFIADFVLFIYGGFGPVEFSMPLRLILLGIGVCLASFGLSLYVTAGLGVSPYDSLPLLIRKATNNKVPFGWARLAVDSSAVVIGYSFGAVVGIGTLVIAFSLGPLVGLMNRRISEPLLRDNPKK